MHKLSKKKVIAITGIIGSGKSSVSKLLCERGYPVLDCDRGSRECIKKGSIGYQQMIDAFSNRIVAEDGSIDRRKVAEIVFSDEEKRKQLEAIQHPLILEWIRKQCALLEEPLVFVEVPLLFESGWDVYFDESWVVTADEKMVFERLKQHRGMRDDEITRRLKTQMKSDMKIKKADAVLINNGSLAELDEQIERLLNGADKTYDEG